jgi:hypothetical protein
LKLNIILGKRKQRLPKLLEELNRQGITDYEFWDAIYLPSIKAGINAAHKQIVEYAKLAGWEEVCIAEDDLQFTNHKSWQYYLNNKPSDYDIYLSMVYIGDIKEDNTVDYFTGLTLYTVNSRFYDEFLDADPTSHLDIALSHAGKFVVCNPFVAKQHNGLSSNTGKLENYDKLLSNRQFYTGT